MCVVLKWYLVVKIDNMGLVDKAHARRWVDEGYCVPVLCLSGTFSVNIDNVGLGGEARRDGEAKEHVVVPCFLSLAGADGAIEGMSNCWG